MFVPVHKRDDKRDCSDYHGISLLSTSYRNVENPGKRQFIDKTNGEQQCGFQNNRSTSVRISCIRQALEKKIGVNNSVMTEVLHNIFIESEGPG
jgi:hypothetical protein